MVVEKTKERPIAFPRPGKRGPSLAPCGRTGRKAPQPRATTALSVASCRHRQVHGYPGQHMCWPEITVLHDVDDFPLMSSLRARRLPVRWFSDESSMGSRFHALGASPSIRCFADFRPLLLGLAPVCEKPESVAPSSGLRGSALLRARKSVNLLASSVEQGGYLLPALALSRITA